MGEWRKVTLAEVLGRKGYIRGPFGSALKRGELLSHGIPVYEQQHAIYGTRRFRFFVGEDKYRELSRFTVRPNDLIVSCSGTLGRVSVIRDGDPAGIISQALLILRPDTKNIDPLFLFYVLSSPAGFHSMVSVSTGSVQVNIAKRSIIEGIEINLPPLAEQRSIAALLGSLDEKIELNQETDETLETTARSIFRDWFIDFGPTRAKVEGRPAYLAPEIWQMFPDRFNEEEMPLHWTHATLGAECELTMGQSPPGDTYTEEPTGLPFYQGRTDFGFRYPTRRIFCTTPARLAEAGDSLVSVRAPVGDLNMAWEKCCIGRGVAGVRHKSGSRSFTYYALCFLQDDLRAYEHTGTVFGAINKEQFEALKIINPGKNVVTAFENTIGTFDECIRANTEENATLAKMRNMLLPKLLTGEIRVRDAEKVVEAVA